MNITQQEIEIYGLVQPYPEIMKKTEEMFNRLEKVFVSPECFYKLVSEEIEKLNTKKIHNWGMFWIKVRRYKRFKRKQLRRGIVGCCLNCDYGLKSRRCLLEFHIKDGVIINEPGRHPDTEKCYFWTRKKR